MVLFLLWVFYMQNSSMFAPSGHLQTKDFNGHCNLLLAATISFNIFSIDVLSNVRRLLASCKEKDFRFGHSTIGGVAGRPVFSDWELARALNKVAWSVRTHLIRSVSRSVMNPNTFARVDAEMCKSSSWKMRGESTPLLLFSRVLFQIVSSAVSLY